MGWFPPTPSHVTNKFSVENITSIKEKREEDIVHRRRERREGEGEGQAHHT
jgi:hypothetical protein